MGILFSEKPEMFGSLHFVLAALAVVFNMAVCRCIRDRDEEQLLKLLRILGLIMIVSEVFKQWFCYTRMFDRQISLIYFPWQLCSVAMYLSFAAGYLKGKAQEAVLVYLSTFSLLGAVMALAYPEGMLQQQIVYTVHSFIYHALIISGSMIAVGILKKRERPSFGSSLPLFGVTVLIAEIINISARYIIRDTEREPDMFYISPFYETTQPVFRSIEQSLGTVPEIIIYLLCIILGAYLIFLAEDRLFYRYAGENNRKTLKAK